MWQTGAQKRLKVKFMAVTVPMGNARQLYGGTTRHRFRFGERNYEYKYSKTRRTGAGFDDTSMDVNVIADGDS
jgi:hypothetical protein